MDLFFVLHKNNISYVRYKSKRQVVDKLVFCALNMRQLEKLREAVTARLTKP